MRNLTTSVASTSTGKFVLLIDPTTGEIHERIAASSLAGGGSSVAMRKTRIVATAGQVSFPLTFTPNGDVEMFRNGVLVDSAAFTVSGTTVTYTPANNGSAALGAMVAGDVIHFYGIA